MGNSWNQGRPSAEELETQLAQPETYENPDLVAALNREQKRACPSGGDLPSLPKGPSGSWRGLTDLLSDPECRQLARAEYDQVKAQLDQLEQTLRQMLPTGDPMDGKNVFLEIRAGVGGRRRPFLRRTSTECTPCTGRSRAGSWSWTTSATRNWGASRELSCLVEGRAPMPSSSMRAASTGSSGCPKPSPGAHPHLHLHCGGPSPGGRGGVSAESGGPAH